MDDVRGDVLQPPHSTTPYLRIGFEIKGNIPIIMHFVHTVNNKTDVSLFIFLLFNFFQGEFTTGGESYVKALELIRDEEKTLQLATLNQRLGYNLYTRGVYADSIKYVICLLF